MKNKFRFRLQNILDLKSFKQDLIKQDLAKLNHQLEKETRLLQDHICKFKNSKEMLSAELISDISSTRIQFINEYIQLINSKISSQKQIIEAISEVMDKKRKEYVEVTKEKKIMQKMKERKLIEHKRTLKTKAQKEADELNIARSQVSDGGVLLNGT